MTTTANNLQKGLLIAAFINGVERITAMMPDDRRERVWNALEPYLPQWREFCEKHSEAMEAGDYANLVASVAALLAAGRFELTKDCSPLH